MSTCSLREHSLSQNDKVNAGGNLQIARQPTYALKRVLGGHFFIS